MSTLSLPRHVYEVMNMAEADDKEYVSFAVAVSMDRNALDWLSKSTLHLEDCLTCCSFNQILIWLLRHVRDWLRSYTVKYAKCISVLTYKALHTGQPCYLADLIDSYEPSRCLRSTNCHLLAVPSCVKSSFASRAFCVSSPNNGNSLPAHIRLSDSLVTFQSRLKSHLFSSAYHV